MIRRPQPPGWIAFLPVLWALLGVVALLALGAMLSPVRAEGQTIPVACAPTSQFKTALGNVGERIMVQGATVGNAEMELWVNPKTRTFTVVMRLPGGSSCMVMSGDGLEHGDAPEGDPS